jgi:hypothetical protein
MVLSCASFGCTTYNYGSPPPLPPATAPAAERCAAAQRVTVSDSSGTAHLMNETSSDGVYLYARGRSVRGQGFTFYRGQERLDVEQGLAELGEPTLLQGYERSRDALSGAKTRQQISRPLWITLLTAGLAATIVGTTQLKDSSGHLNGTALAVTGAGLGGMLLSTPFLYLDYASSEKAAAYDLQGKIYVPGAEEEARLASALEAQHQRTARACGR